MTHKLKTLAVLATFSTAAYAVDPGAKHAFKDAKADVALEVERNKGEVYLHVLARNMKQYDYVIIERSGNESEFFSQVNYIQSQGADIIDGSYVVRADKYPLPSNAEIYYRVKTVGKDGTMRIFPSVALKGN